HGVAQRETVPVVLEAKIPVYALDEPEHCHGFGLDLLGKTKNMGVIEGHRPDARKTGKRAGAFIAIHGSQRRQPHRQIAVTMQSMLVDSDMVRAIHRSTNQLFLVLKLHWRIHIILEVIPMARSFVKLHPCELRRIHVLIAHASLDINDISFQDRTDHRALREPDGESRTDDVRDHEETQFLPQLPMVTLLGLLEKSQMLLERLLGGPSSTINALKHLVFLIAAPIGSGDSGELESLDHASRRHVRTTAEIHPVPLPVQ